MADGAGGGSMNNHYEIEIDDAVVLSPLRDVQPLLEAAASVIEARYAGDLLDALERLRGMDVRTTEYAQTAIDRLHAECGVRT